ncbi:hypothetical protein HZF05_11190 [Sphingomonas sp. CGMCC 1.13654]|uniref:Uncharacterized protein n=1 Tax=Sphingomonas chungangi TaxID=2683589 RepID=A0A838L801_9SPHN|nr:hypothetical protein [Sphingomonas chungangi]MBA2934659.1 hypothetical protein [Sphingomonas chungangi]MVW57694.1 hypothetical protein [Sphingomonas chungangi]
MRLDDRLVRLSSREYELATILEFDPEASLAPGSLQPVPAGDGDCLVPASRFSLETWARLTVGVDGHDDDDDGDRSSGISRFLDRRCVVLAA